MFENAEKEILVDTEKLQRRVCLQFNTEYISINIFQDELIGAWGIDLKECLNFSTKKQQDRNTYIDIKIDSSSCDWLDFGISWNNWLYTDISRNIKKLDLVFDLKVNKAQNFTISFEDYTGKKLSYQIDKSKSYLFCAFLISHCWYLISYAQEVRSYSLGYFFSLLSIILFISILRLNLD